MKPLFSFVALFISLAYFTPARADFQPRSETAHSQIGVVEDKIYIPLERLHFSNDGIFFLTSSNHLAAINQLGYDSFGYYITGSRRLSSYVATCNNCGYTYYNRSPQPCEKCHKALGFDIRYEDIWDGIK